jgi:hypothetical protein
MGNAPVPSGTERFILTVVGLFFTVGTAFSGIKEDTLYGDRMALAEIRLIQQGKLTTNVKELQSTLMVATVMEAKMAGYAGWSHFKNREQYVTSRNARLA